MYKVYKACMCLTLYESYIVSYITNRNLYYLHTYVYTFLYMYI